MANDSEAPMKRSLDPKWFPLIVAAMGICGTIGGVLLGQHLAFKSALTQKAIDFSIEERREAIQILEDFSLAAGERTYAASDLQFAIWWEKGPEEISRAEKDFLATRRAMIVRNGFFIAHFKTRFGDDLKQQYIHLTTKYDELDGLLSDLKNERKEDTAVKILKCIDEINIEQGFILGRAMRTLDEQ